MKLLKISPLLTLALLATSAVSGAAPVQKAPIQHVTVTIDGMGYHPAAIRVKGGQPVHLTFISKAESCANDVVFPSLGKTLNLKVGQKREIVFTPKKGQTLNYICAMKMVKGRVTVQ